MSGLKKAMWVLGAIFGLLLAAIIVIPLVVDVDQYRPKIVEAANQRINGKMELGKLSLNLWGRIRIQVAGLSVLDASGRKVLSVNDAYFHLPFASLLSGSPSLVFKMEKPEVSVVRNKAGKLNVMSLMKPSAPEEPGKPSEAPAPKEGASKEGVAEMQLPGLVTRARLSVELRDALVAYRDETTALETRVEDLNLLLKDISLSRTTGIEMWADLNTRLGKTFALKGPAKLTGSAKPELVGSRFDHLSLAAFLDMSKVEMQMPGMFQKASGIPAQVDLAITASEKEARIEKLDAKFHNAEIKSQGVISNLTSPVVEFKMASNEIDLKPWVELLPMLKEYELGGTARLEASAQGPSDKLGYQAQLKVAALTAKSPMLKAQPRMDALIKVATDQIESMLLTMKAPGNDLRISGKLVSFTQPRFDFKVESSGMDLDQLVNFPPPGAKGKAKGTPADEGTPDASKMAKAPPADFDAMLDPMRENKILAQTSGEIGVNIKGMKAYGVAMSDITSKMTLKDLAASIDSFAMKLWKGSIQASASTQLKPKAPTYRFKGQVSGLDLAEAVSSQLQLFKNTVLGKASFEIDGNGSSFNPPLATERLNAKGKLRVDQATFATIDVGKMTSEALNQAIQRVSDKVPALKDKKIGGLPEGETKYEFISTDFSIDGGKFSAPNFVAKAIPNKGVDLNGSTAVGLKDYSLKTRWEIIDTYNLTHARDLSVEQSGVKVDHILAEGSGPVRFPVSANCTLMAPCYSYTEVPEALAKVALNNVSQAVQGKAKEELRKRAESLIPKSAPPAVQEKVKDLGKKLFGR